MYRYVAKRSDTVPTLQAICVSERRVRYETTEGRPRTIGPRSDRLPTATMTGLDFADIATKAATVGGATAQEGFTADTAVESKGEDGVPAGPADVVTEFDREAQRQVVAVLRRHDPDASIVGEENDAEKTVPSTGRAWVIDPIDGTFNFVRGIHHWTTSVAAAVDGEAAAACSVLPALETTYHADRTDSYRNGERIHVSGRSTVRSATVAPIIPPAYGHREVYAEGLGRLFDRFGTTVRFCSAQATLALLAQGSIEAAVTPQRPNPWDSLAGVHLIRQAGGTVTDLDGERWTTESDSLAASNGAVHDELLEVARGMR